MAAQSRVGRPRKQTLRVELRLNASDPATKALLLEAAGRDITLQQHITDLLIARYLNRHVPVVEPPALSADIAAAIAEEWMM